MSQTVKDVVEKNIYNTNTGEYAVELKGQFMPKEALKEAVLAGREFNHPIGNAKGYELISLPEEFLHRKHEYMQHFAELKAEQDKVYIIILGLDREERTVEYIEKPTGKFRMQDHVQKGTKKWVTHYVVYKDETLLDDNDNPIFDRNGDNITKRKELGLFATKGDAIKFARDYGNNHKAIVYIELEKRLDNASSRVADLEPIIERRPQYKTEKMNHFMLFGKGTMVEEEQEETPETDTTEEETVDA